MDLQQPLSAFLASKNNHTFWSQLPGLSAYNGCNFLACALIMHQVNPSIGHKTLLY